MLYARPSNRRLLSALLLLLLAWTTPSLWAADPSEPLTVMTYNLRYASRTPPNAWPDRRPLVAEVIRQVNPDVFGTQEGLYAQLKEIHSDLPAYEWIGLGREGGSRGEFMAVFYRKARLEPLAFDHFWLSDTPDVIGSTTWGNDNRRMVTWVKFLDRITRVEFYLFNTHFDHQIQRARERSAELLRQRIQDLNTTLPVLVTGDFNCATNNAAYRRLVADDFLKDTWYAAAQRTGEGLGSFNGFREIPKNDTRIDWILARGKVDVEWTGIETFARDGRFPSDHFPVAARVRLPR